MGRGGRALVPGGGTYHSLRNLYLDDWGRGVGDGLHDFLNEKEKRKKKEMVFCLSSPPLTYVYDVVLSWYFPCMVVNLCCIHFYGSCIMPRYLIYVFHPYLFIYFIRSRHISFLA